MNEDDLRQTRSIAVFGTGSNVGKSVVATALCRIYRDRDVRVAPFKAQNMSNNSCVTPSGGEMGRAQVVQAEAARLAPSELMNPVLLKPTGDSRSQVIVRGEPEGQVHSRQFGERSGELFEKALDSYRELSTQYEQIIIEGAGSCVEMNLRDRDFANWRMAHAADAGVLLVADIDRGGVFAQVIGTLELLSEEERSRIVGILINRFRGDRSLFSDGVTYLEENTDIPVIGVIPYFEGIEIDPEDSVPLRNEIRTNDMRNRASDSIQIGVVKLPRISNYTDFDPLNREEHVDVHYLETPKSLSSPDVIVLPGTKNVRGDLQWLRKNGWVEGIHHYVREGGRIWGICGGYQMLGSSVQDPHGVEGEAGTAEGLGLLDVETVMRKEKTRSLSAGRWRSTGDPVHGYEIHMGQTSRGKELSPLIEVREQNGNTVDEQDGAINENGTVLGTYFHDLFSNRDVRRHLLQTLDPEWSGNGDPGEPLSGIEFRNRQYDLLADHFREYMDLYLLKERIRKRNS